jgi:hypothetical protein
VAIAHYTLRAQIAPPVLPASTMPGALPQIYIDSHTFDGNGQNPVWKRAYTCSCSPSGGVMECVKDMTLPGGP